MGSSKVKRQQLEIDELKTENAELQTEVKTLTAQVQTNAEEHAKTTDNLRNELNKIHGLFPKIKEMLRIENICRYLGLMFFLFFSSEVKKKLYLCELI